MEKKLEIGDVKNRHTERCMREVKQRSEDLKEKMKNTFFHIRYIVLCDHFGDIGFIDCVIGMEERVRGGKKKKRTKKIWRNHIKSWAKKTDKVITVHS